MSRLDDILKIQLVRLRLRNGRIPIDHWLECLDTPIRARISARLRRLSLGNFGDCKNVGDGVSELRMNFGPGYRIYFGKKSEKIIIFICGGDKKSQVEDIKRARRLWAEYLRGEINNVEG